MVVTLQPRMVLDSGNAKEVVGAEDEGQQETQGSGAQGGDGHTWRAVGPGVGGRNWCAHLSRASGPKECT